MANVSLSLAAISWEPMSSLAALENAPENLASVAECLHLRDDILIDLHNPYLQSNIGNIVLLGFDTRKRSIVMSIQLYSFLLSLFISKRCA